MSSALKAVPPFPAAQGLHGLQPPHGLQGLAAQGLVAAQGLQAFAAQGLVAAQGLQAWAAQGLHPPHGFAAQGLQAFAAQGLGLASAITMQLASSASIDALSAPFVGSL